MKIVVLTSFYKKLIFGKFGGGDYFFLVRWSDSDMLSSKFIVVSFEGLFSTFFSFKKNVSDLGVDSFSELNRLDNFSSNLIFCKTE